MVTPDGRYLFFESRAGKIWAEGETSYMGWVGARIVKRNSACPCRTTWTGTAGGSSDRWRNMDRRPVGLTTWTGTAAGETSCELETGMSVLWLTVGDGDFVRQAVRI